MLQVAPINVEKNIQSSVKIATLDVTGMKCAGCVKAVERQLTQNDGVVSACVNLITEVAVVKYKEGTIEPENIAKKLTSTGFPSKIRISDNSHKEGKLSAAERRKKENQEQLQKLITAAILLIFSAIGHIDHIGGPSIPVLSNIWFHAGLATVALIFPARSIIIDGVRSLRHLMPNMNTLVGLGTISAYLASLVALLFPQLGWECFFDEPVMLLGFVILGRTLEGRARSRATKALESLIALKPQTARLIGQPSIDQESGIEIPLEQVRVGEWVKVLPGEKIPVDGKIVDGITAVDESSITGESLPVAKEIGNIVTAGTINKSGAIAVLVTRTGQDTTLAKIIASVEDAQTHKAPVQQLADTVAGYFAYGVMSVASITFLFWYFIGTKIWPEVLTTITTHSSHQAMEIAATSPLLLSLKLAIAVLVIACPCALGLATPTAILVGTSIGAERGLSIRGGDILETIHKLDTIVFDKTGTLTSGKPKVTDCIPCQDLDTDNLLAIAAAVESGTNHPLAEAIVSAAKQKNLTLPTTTNFHTEPGLGVSAIVAGKQVSLGNAEWMSDRGIIIDPEITKTAESLAEAGKTIVYIARESQLIGSIALQDILRPDAIETVKTLQEMGLEVVLLSGDRATVARAIAKQLGISQYFAAVKPEGKATIIQSLQENDRIVAMVGDGINDAPALARADIGISLHHSTDVARETAGIVLMREKLIDVVESIKLSQATFNKIRQNLLWALGYNTIAIPVAAGVLLPGFGILLSPVVAAALMASSSVIVVTNSLLLRRQFKRST
ncbi:MAG: heavy metal translocating P-type ATPase [Prochloraceae cyanobacterium]